MRGRRDSSQRKLKSASQRNAAGGVRPSPDSESMLGSGNLPAANTTTTNDIKDKFATVSQDLVIRNLRRRFFHALRQEDASLALRLYQSTRTDWENLIQEEAVANLASLSLGEGRSSHSSNRRKSSKQSNNIPVLVKQRSGWGSRRRRSTTESNNMSQSNNNNTSSLWMSGKEEDDPHTSILLPRVLKPCDFFVEDDFLHAVTDPYQELAAFENDANSTSGQTTNNNSGTSPNDTGSRRGSWFRRSASTPAVGSEQQQPTTETPVALLHQPPMDETRRTTPLHEAARIGNGDLVRCLLEWAGGGGQYDINAKNGVGRTALHCVAGGLTLQEATRVQFQDDVAILTPQPPTGDSSGIRRSRSRFWRNPSRRSFRTNSERSQQQLLHQHQEEQKKTARVSRQRWSKLNTERLDAALALLTADASTNAVDQHGRTALHYSAALGRSEMTIAFFNSFGTLLTVVDSFSRTPAEWAAVHDHKALAAKLEARALLYMDPLDMDLLESIQEQNAEQNGRAQAPGSLSPPFAWFTTFSMDRVQKEREFRIKVTLERMRKILDRLNGGKSARDVLQKSSSNHSKNSDDISSTSVTDSSPPSPVPGQDLRALGGLHEGQAAELLAINEWDVKITIAAFFEDPFGVFTRANIGLPPPTPQDRATASKEAPDNEDGEEDGEEHKESIEESNEDGSPTMSVCLICCEEIDTTDKARWRNLDCGHGFCTSCLGDYITESAKSREFGLFVHCPHHECNVSMTLAQVSDLTPWEKVKTQLTEAANSNFVVKARDFRFCPCAGCENVVKFIPPKNKGAEVHNILSAAGAVCCTPESHSKRKENSQYITYEGIFDEEYFNCQSNADPPRAHRFCFQCDEGAHWPVSCLRLEQWKSTVEEHVNEVQEDGENEDDYNNVSHKLWIKANTRPCPKCKAPIEKNDGCNHVTCCNPHCKHEFCWICRNDWSLHGTNTGGFFRCNRWVEDGQGHQFYDKAPTAEELRTPTDEDLTDPRRMRQVYGTSMHESRVAHKRAREMARFLHHYQRFSAHADSAALEEKMASSAKERLKAIVQAAIDFSGDPAFNFGGKGLSFIFDAFVELRECRSVLQYSYAFSFFRYGGSKVRILRRKLAEGLAFEQIQSELEMLTEQMSDLVSRKHFRATQSQILYMTLTAAQKRRDFSSFLMRVLSKDGDEADSSEDGSERSDGSGGDRATAGLRLPFFHPINAVPVPDILGLAGADNPVDHQREAFFGDPGHTALDPAFQASLQAFRENAGNLELLNANTSYDSVEDDEGERDWSCAACTFINARGRVCSMCGTPNVPS